MGQMDAGMALSGMHDWSIRDVVLLWVMWAVMMAAMMTPTATPVLLLLAQLSRRRRARGDPAVPAAVFLSGYLLIWSAFAAVATLGQWGLHAAALLSPAMATTSPLLGASLLIGAGVYQFSPPKDVCLATCRSPLGFLSTEWREGWGGALIMGLRHGAYCVGCCWLLMGLLFLAGVMSLFWVAAIGGFALIEKVAPGGRVLGRVTGAVLVVWGLWLGAAAVRG